MWERGAPECAGEEVNLQTERDQEREPDRHCRPQLIWAEDPRQHEEG
jgi:hypothetical protein